MRVYDHPVCAECSRFLSRGAASCDTGHEPPDPATVHAVGAFDGAFGTMVHALKYDGCRDLAEPMGRLLADRVGYTPTAVVAVPTAPSKRRKRGFGHAEEIARACADELGARLIPGALEFTRRVADQTKLGASRRKANMNGAFRAREGLNLDGMDILVVDDVYTTGATLGEAARALKEAGAGQISGGVIALNLSMQLRGR